jgi:hypothetical protein
MAEQAVKVRLERVPLRPIPTRYLVIAGLEIDQRNCLCRCQYLTGVDLPATHRPPQNCYAGSSISSWPIPVREAHHGKGAQYSF